MSLLMLLRVLNNFVSFDPLIILNLEFRERQGRDVSGFYFDLASKSKVLLEV
jgi:hypothetical protein